jgi:hypothetical protein
MSSICSISQTPYWYNLSGRVLRSIQSNAFDKSNSTQLQFTKTKKINTTVNSSIMFYAVLHSILISVVQIILQ